MANKKETPAKATFGLHKVEITQEENDLQNATHSAMEHFDTFEGNIIRLVDEEVGTHYVFTKIR